MTYFRFFCGLRRYGTKEDNDIDIIIDIYYNAHIYEIQGNLVFKWNEEKNSILKSQRGFSFNDVVEVIGQGGVIDHYKHPNVEKYPRQFIYVVALGGYIHYVPYVFDGEDIFLKNIIPSRKLHQKYAKENR